MANPSKVLAKVEQIDSKGDGVYQLTFSVPSRYTKYLAGQFLHLTLEEFDPTTGYWPESRVFSIASRPRQEHLIVVYSVKGAYTKRMEKELAVGSEVWLKLPYGDFVIEESPVGSPPLVLVAGGTGVSPYIPFLLQPRETSGPVHLYYGVRKAEHQLFARELEQLKAQPWFHLHLVVGQLLTLDQMATDLGAAFAKAHFYLSGPPVMIKTFRTQLAERGLAGHQIHIDEWE